MKRITTIVTLILICVLADGSLLLADNNPPAMMDGVLRLAD
jgi:hypothetical protein